MTNPWSNTVAALAGMPPAGPHQWPAARTRRVALWDHPVPRPDADTVSFMEWETLGVLVRRGALNGGELAYALGINLTTACARITGLQWRGLVAKSGRTWECTERGRRLWQAFEPPAGFTSLSLTQGRIG